jgi:hypothetical protein
VQIIIWLYREQIVLSEQSIALATRSMSICQEKGTAPTAAYVVQGHASVRIANLNAVWVTNTNNNNKNKQVWSMMAFSDFLESSYFSHRMGIVSPSLKATLVAPVKIWTAQINALMFLVTSECFCFACLIHLSNWYNGWCMPTVGHLIFEAWILNYRMELATRLLVTVHVNPTGEEMTAVSL